jgi:hypothetical protein
VPPVKTETRAFCEKLLELNRIFTREDINAISSRVDRDVWKYKGGWYTNPETGVTTPFCRHEWVQQITIKRPSVETAPEAPLIEVGEIKINTIKEGKEFAEKIIEEALGVKAKISISSELKVENFEKRLIQVKKLFNEYKVEDLLEDEIQFVFASNKSVLGVVKRYGVETIQGTKYRLRQINVGHINDNSITDKRRVWKTEKGYIQFAENNKVDDKNLQIAVTTHEFAHVITSSRAAKYNNVTKEIQYWDQLKVIQKQYWQERDLLRSTQDVKELNKIYLGKYSETNIDEFHAEAFMEYKLSANPSKYAILVGNLIDKNFKK